MTLFLNGAHGSSVSSGAEPRKDRVVKAEIIPWEEKCVGVFLKWESGRDSAYFVGDLNEANEEMARLGVATEIIEILYTEALH